MSPATPAQVRQWSEEVAADPASLSFLPLAAAYREQGRHDAALKLVIRGLEKHPGHVEAHYLLGLLYREGGEQLKAFDEWDIALALDPDHHGSRREIGLISHARGDHTLAVRHLERALANDAFDQQVRDALEESWARSNGGRGASPATARPAPSPAAVAPAPAPPPAPMPASPPTPVPTPVAAPAAAVEPAAVTSSDATHFDAVTAEFAALAAERGIVGAVLMDDQGFVLAGQMSGEFVRSWSGLSPVPADAAASGADRGPEVAAVLSGAPAEAGRALAHLGLGAWKGILVETPEAVVRLAPAGDGMIAVAGRREVPTGWVLRV
ncbi:MAG TPA: tetratricopeptide repeat protein, partial [Longimicrobium sp.]|nr:tetratricopeptide repeat protein [Longimicrobium sp.]